MKLSHWAKKQGISYYTAWTWFKNGKIPNSKQMPSGTILIDDVESTDKNYSRICIYARVSNHSRKEDLNRQVERISQFSSSSGISVDKIYKEIASGVNDERPIFWKMIESNPTIIIVEHKDRLTRFGFNYLERLLKRLNCQIIVMNRDTEDENDLIKDLVSIITSFCCRLYGLRSGHVKAKEITKYLSDEDNSVE